MDEQIEHVVPLPADLQPRLDPIELGGLEKFGVAQRREELLLLQPLGDIMSCQLKQV